MRSSMTMGCSTTMQSSRLARPTTVGCLPTHRPHHICDRVPSTMRAAGGGG